MLVQNKTSPQTYRLVSQHRRYSFFLNKTSDRRSSLHTCRIYRAHIIAIRLENSYNQATKQVCHETHTNTAATAFIKEKRRRNIFTQSNRDVTGKTV